MVKYTGDEKARDNYDEIMDPISPYDQDGRNTDEDFAHEVASGTDKAMTVLSLARKLGDNAVAQLAGLRAELYEVQYIRPAVLHAVNLGMAKVEESGLDDAEYAQQMERTAYYLALTNKRNSLRDELAALNEQEGEKALDARFNKVHSTYIRERRERLRAEKMAGEYGPTRKYPDLRYSFQPEKGTLMRKDLPKTVHDGFTSIAAELLTRHGIDATPTKWGGQLNRSLALADSASDRLTVGYHGTLGEVRIEQLPMDEEEKKQFIQASATADRINYHSITRLLLSVAHGGIDKIDPPFGHDEVILYVILDQEKNDYVACTRRAANIHENTESIDRTNDAIARAKILDAQGLAHPLGGGLPTLGKK